MTSLIQHKKIGYSTGTAHGESGKGEDNNILELTRHVLAITLYRLFNTKSGRP